MKTIELKTLVCEYDSENDLPEEDQELLAMTRIKAKSAYAPYSKFKVGAGIRLENEKMFFGNNQENAAYPSGLCAERVALFGAASIGFKFKTLVISCWGNDPPVNTPVTPCGACRQVMIEYETKQGSPIRLIMTGETGKVWVVESASALLPLAFDGSKLKG
jgi:cytidine deaminase